MHKDPGPANSVASDPTGSGSGSPTVCNGEVKKLCLVSRVYLYTPLAQDQNI